MIYSGVLVHKKIVLTATDCLADYDRHLNRKKNIVGADNVRVELASLSEKTIGVERIIVPPQFKNHDIAILILSEEVTDKTIMPILVEEFSHLNSNPPYPVMLYGFDMMLPLNKIISPEMDSKLLWFGVLDREKDKGKISSDNQGSPAVVFTSGSTPFLMAITADFPISRFAIRLEDHIVTAINLASKKFWDFLRDSVPEEVFLEIRNYSLQNVNQVLLNEAPRYCSDPRLAFFNDQATLRNLMQTFQNLLCPSQLIEKHNRAARCGESNILGFYQSLGPETISYLQNMQNRPYPLVEETDEDRSAEDSDEDDFFEHVDDEAYEEIQRLRGIKRRRIEGPSTRKFKNGLFRLTK